MDETTIVFHLRDDVYFHDGNRMTAEDVIFSLCYGAQSNFTSTLFGAIDPENTKALDDYTLEITLANPCTYFLDLACTYVAIPMYIVNENPDWNDFKQFLEERCFPKSRAFRKTILKKIGADGYDTLQILEKTDGGTLRSE